MIDISELEQLIDQLSDKKLLPRVAENALFNASAYVAEESIKEPNHRYTTRTGTLGNAVTYDVVGLSSSIFIDLNRAPHGEWIYNGTKAHEIVPKNTKALSWAIGGQRFFSKGHTVKGIKADPFILNTFNKKQSIFTRKMSESMTEQLQEAIY